jgi:hypothetical protein
MHGQALPPRPAAVSPLKYANVFDTLESELVTSSARSAVLVGPDECELGVPTTAITVGDAREIVRKPGQNEPILDAIWTALIRRAHTEPRRWEQTVLWTMLPRLRCIANRLYRAWQIDIDDIRSEVIVGFLETLRRIAPDQQYLGARLWWNTYGYARRMCRHVTREVACENIERVVTRRVTTADTTPPPPMHSAASADQHDRTAIEGERLGSIANRLGLQTVAECRRSEDTLPVRRLDRRKYWVRSRQPRAANGRTNDSVEAA